MATLIQENNFADAYREMLSRVFLTPDFECAPRGQKIKELLNVQVTIANPYSNLFKNKVRSIPKTYLANELLLYFSGTNDASKFEKAASLWGKIKNSDDTVNSAYGHLIFCKRNCRVNRSDLGSFMGVTTQWNWAKYSLMQDKDSRQAILIYNQPEYQFDGNKDFPCTLTNQFFIRENKLYLTYSMRSNDAIKGTTFDFVWAMLLMQCMRLELLKTYPDLGLGSLTYFGGSFHLYESDFEKAALMLEHPFEEDSLPLIDVNPILTYAIMAMLNGDEIKPVDPFIKWINDNRSI